MNLYDNFTINVSLPASGEEAAVAAGALGSIIDVVEHRGTTYYTAEFCEEDGTPYATHSLTASQMKPLPLAKPEPFAA